MLQAKSDLRWIAAILGTLAIILIINPVGFVGGGWDDWHYLNAARCWVDHGPCLPADHWQGRWPIVAPLAGIIAILGESRVSVGLPSLAYSIGCLVLTAWLGNRIAGKPVGYLTALLLLVVPAFAIELLDPTVEAAELFFLLAGACCASLYAERKGVWLPFLTGLFLSLAFQVRETALAAAPLAGVLAFVIARHDRRSWIAAVAGAIMPLAAEALTFWISAGDPLWRRGLSVAHTQIPSSELMGPIDSNRPPFFNSAYIANWRHEPGIHVHWLVDGLINLAANAKAGLTIVGSLLLFALYGRSIERRDRRIVAWCLAAAFYWACFLIYALAIDPKARMMLTPILLTALALAVILLKRQKPQGFDVVTGTVIFVAWAAGLAITLIQPNVTGSEERVEHWARQHPGQIETDEATRRHLELTSAVEDFDDLGSDRSFVALRLSMRCQIWAAEIMKGAVTVVDRSPMGRFDPPEARMVNNLCLFRYARPVKPEAIMRAKAAP